MASDLYNEAATIIAEIRRNRWQIKINTCKKKWRKWNL